MFLELPAYEINPKVPSVPQVILKTPQYPIASSAVRINSGGLSSIAMRTLPSRNPALSEIGSGGAFYVMENIHQNDLNPKFSPSVESTPTRNSPRSPSSTRSVKSETAPLPRHANVNIIVHNDFEKNVPIQQIKTLDSREKSAKVSYYEHIRTAR